MTIPISSMGKTKVCKSFRFEAAHHLPYHKGKCKNPHGHSYKVVICYEGPIQPVVPDNSESGMVVDFYEISRIWKELEEVFDHGEQTLNAYVHYSTAENLATYIAHYFSYHLSHKTARLHSVRVYETETGYAELELGNGSISGR